MPYVLLAVALTTFAFGAAAEAPWRDFRDDEQGFAVQFPAEPEVQRNAYRDVTFVNYMALWGEHMFHIVAYNLSRAVPDQPDAAYYHPRLLDYARNHDKRIEGEHMVTLAGRPAAEAKMTDSVIGADYLVDALAAGKRFYVIASAGRPGHAETAEAKHFRDSFRLLGH